MALLSRLNGIRFKPLSFRFGSIICLLDIGFLATIYGASAEVIE